MAGKRRFGRVRRLISGRWQARYHGPDGIDRPAPETFRTKRDAERWLAVVESEVVRGEWTDPDAGRVAFSDYAASWVEERAGLRPKTVQLYRYLLHRHLEPDFGNLTVVEVSDARVRRWRKNLLDSGVSDVTTAKAYRLLKAIFNTAVDDGLIRRNPCRIKGAGQERSPERPVLTLGQVFALADAIDPRYRALVLLAVFASLRWGEVAALRRCDIDITTRTVRVERQLAERSGGGFAFAVPKSDAGQRLVVVPEVIAADLSAHLAAYAAPDSDGLLFTNRSGGPLRHSNFRRRVWLPALAAAGLPAIHVHDLRHTGNHYAAGSGATLRDLMDRMGHSTTRAALIYLHGSTDRQQAIAERLNRDARRELDRTVPRRSGTQRARKDGEAS